MRKRLPVVILLLAVVAAIGFYWWTTQRDTGGAERLGGSGTVEATEVQVASIVGGRISAVKVAEGDTVKTGQVLFTIDAAVLKQQAEAAAANVRVAQAGLKQVQDDDGTRAEEDAARARIDAANAQLRAAQAQLAYATVTAPATGTVTVLAADSGENATPGRALATLADLTKLSVSVFIPETRIAQVKIGDTAVVTTDSSAKEFEGRVVFVASQAEFTPSNVETKEQRVKLVYEVRLDVAAPGGELKPGMPVDVSFE